MHFRQVLIERRVTARYRAPFTVLSGTQLEVRSARIAGPSPLSPKLGGSASPRPPSPQISRGKRPVQSPKGGSTPSRRQPSPSGVTTPKRGDDGAAKTFFFDRLFGPDESDEDLFDALEEDIAQVLHGTQARPCCGSVRG